MSTIVFNTDIENFGNRYYTKTLRVPNTPEWSYENQLALVKAKLFEQLLLFDKVAIKTDRNNISLYVLLRDIGINRIEELLERDILRLVLWTPVIVSTIGRNRPDGTIDESTVIGVPPIVAGSYTEDDSDPERNLEVTLQKFGLNRERRRIFKRIAEKRYVLPTPGLAGQCVDIIINAYLKNEFTPFGLPFSKDPNDLNVEERKKLLTLGYNVLETSILAEKQYKSYDNYVYHKLTKESIQAIESGLRISENTSKILTIADIPKIKELIVSERIPFEYVFRLRHNPIVKDYRKWINNRTTDSSARDISREYQDAITGKNKFWQQGEGKFMRTVGMVAVGAGLEILTGGMGLVGGLGLSLFDAYVLEGITKGWDPKMFVDLIEVNANQDNEVRP